MKRKGRWGDGRRGEGAAGGKGMTRHSPPQQKKKSLKKL